MTRGSSQRLIGRAREHERLRDALRTVRESDRSVVLLSGEAGIGKSRLIAELERSVAVDPPSSRPVAILRGDCVDVGESLAYLPIIELLDGARHLGPELHAESAAIRRALGGATDLGPPDLVRAAPDGRAATFLRIRELLAAAATERDVIAVIEDVHWADRSTLDIVSFLSRRLVRTGVLLVLSYRSDELNRRHPLKPVLADLERHATLDHIRVEPLGASDVRDLVAGIVGDETAPPDLERVVRLADGNPFHVEELLSLDDDRRLPPSLREVLDARLDQLEEAGRRVVELAAVIGRQVDTRLLVAVADVPSAEVGLGLRQAVEARALVPADDARNYRFRHALFREVVYADIPPTERVEIHRRIGVALTDHPELGDMSPAVAVADRARHWLGAHAEPEAFASLVEAARSAATATAWSEACSAYEAALDLWERVIDPASVAGATRSEILEMAAEIAWYEGDARRALALNRRAQADPDVLADSIKLGRLSVREAGLLDDLGDLRGEGEAARRAVRLIPETPSQDRTAAVLGLGLHALREGRVRDAIDLFDEAIGTGETGGAESEVAASRALLTIARVESGEVERPRATISQLDGVLPKITEPVAWSFVATWVPWAWIGMGDHVRAIEYADRLLVDAGGRGLDRGVGLWCLAPRALAEFRLGRWDEALATIGRQGDYTWGIDAAVHLRSVAAQITAGRDDCARARSLADEAIEIARPGFPEQAMVARLAAAWVELLDDQPDVALGHIRAAWDIAPDWEGLVIRSVLLWMGFWALGDIAMRSRAAGADRALVAALAFREQLRDALETALGDTREADGRGSGVAYGPRLVLELAAAEASRLDRSDDAVTWTSIADRLERAGDLPRMVFARQREAEAVLRARGDRDRAVAAIRAAMVAAESMGATRLSARLAAIARAAKLELAIEPRRASAQSSVRATPWGLSAREVEVLALLAEGRTNREIGDALFISDKTASVHVTHIMTKLGVSRRTEAALLAVRSGIGRSVSDDASVADSRSGLPSS